MAQDGVKLARRSSGGGAVFHDLGNSCFTFMAGKPGYDKQVSTGIILAALAALGIDAQASGRNDLELDTPQEGAKFPVRPTAKPWIAVFITAPCC